MGATLYFGATYLPVFGAFELFSVISQLAYFL
jgi:hypothetical protein